MPLRIFPSLPDLAGLTGRVTAVEVTATEAHDAATDLAAAIAAGNATHDGFDQRIDRLEDPAIGLAPSASALMAGSQDVVVKLSRTMADTNYRAAAVHSGGGTCAVIAKTTTTATVRVTVAAAVGSGYVAVVCS